MRSPRRRQPRSRRLVAGVIGVLILAALGLGANVAYANVRAQADQLQADLTTSIQAGQAELEAGKTSLAQANSKHDATFAADAINHFAGAKAEFESAGQQADDSRLLRYLEQVPEVGSQVRSKHLAVALIADMGAQIAAAGIELAKLDQHLINPPTQGPAGRTLLTVLDQTTASLALVKNYLIQAKADADRVQMSLLTKGQQTSFQKARTSIDEALNGFTEFERLAPILKEVFGANGSRAYLIEQVNPAELRAGGGFIGSYSVLKSSQGTLSVPRSGDSYDLVNPRPKQGQPGFIPVPTPYREVVPYVSWSFVDSNIYPDFPSNAKAAIQFVQPRVGKIDGVIAFDYYTVAAMLHLTGPMIVPGYGITVTSSNFVTQVIRLDIGRTASHKSLLAALAGPLMAKISSLPADRWPALIGTLNTMAGQRHLQAYFTNPLVQAEVDRVGWSGTVNPLGARDYFMEVEDNYFGNKDNYFVSRHYTITLTRRGGVLHHLVTVDVVNRTPYGSFERLEYRAGVRFFMPGLATAISQSLARPRYPNPHPPSGLKMADGWLYIQCCGSKGAATFQYDTPWAVDPSGFAQIYWQKQPGTSADTVDIVWTDDAGRRFTTNGTFTQDLAITLSSSGVTLTMGQPAKATLPTLSLG